MPQADETYDYTKNDRPASERTFSGTTPFGGPEDTAAVIDDYEMPDIEAMGKDADEIEAEHGFNQIPPGGPYELEIVGFETNPETKKRVKREWRKAYFGDREESYECYTVRVRFAALPGQTVMVLTVDPETNQPILDESGKKIFRKVVLNRSYTIKDTFELPPMKTGDPQQDRVNIKCFLEGTKQQNGRENDKGLMASKFYHFVERIGFPVKKGERLPPEALVLDNWIGRKVMGPVKTGKPNTVTKKEFDKNTGEKVERTFTYINNQVDLFKYSVHPETIERYKRAGELATAATHGTHASHSASRNLSRPVLSPDEQKAADEKDSEQATAARNQADIAARKASSASAAGKKPKVNEDVLSNI